MADDNPTTPEMVERVARAIYEATSLPPDAQTWEALDFTVKWGWHEWAAAAIEAMREPTEAMLQCSVWAGWSGVIEGCASAERERGKELYQAMIDAALGK